MDSPEIPKARTTLSVSISEPIYKCDGCKRMVHVVRTGPDIEGQVCDKCAGL